MPWSPFVPLGGEIIEAPAAISLEPNTTASVYGWGLDGNLWWNRWFDNKWHGWKPHLPLKLTSEPAVLSVGSLHEQVFACGPDGAVWTIEWKGSLAWKGWQSLGGVIRDAPAVVSRAPKVKSLYARGLDDALWQNSWFDGKWGGWERHNDGGILTSGPSVISTGPLHEQVFVRGADNAVWTKTWWVTNRWTGWESLGGDIQGAPTAISRSPGSINVYARGRDDRLWQNSRMSGGKWSGWIQHPDGFPLTTRPAADSLGPDHEQIYVRGRDGGVWTKWWVPQVGNRIRVHLVDCALGTAIVNDSTSMFGQVAAMWQIYAGGSPSFWIEPASFNKIDVANYYVVDVGECKGTPTDEQKSLFSKHRFGAASNEVVIYNALGTNPAQNGCATHPSGQPGAVVAAPASPWTMAHELGHVCGLKHVNDSTRLMFGGGTWGITNPPPELSAEERQTIAKSGLVFK